MAIFERTAEVVWTGDLRGGQGQVSTGSGVLKAQSYAFRNRFGDVPGTNPEELIAAAHAACYSMALVDTLSAKGFRPERIQVRAGCTISSQKESGFRITKMRLEVHGQVPGVDLGAFRQIAQEAEKSCPVSNALRGGVDIELAVVGA